MCMFVTRVCMFVSEHSYLPVKYSTYSPSPLPHHGSCCYNHYLFNGQLIGVYSYTLYIYIYININQKHVYCAINKSPQSRPN